MGPHMYEFMANNQVSCGFLRKLFANNISHFSFPQIDFYLRIREVPVISLGWESCIICNRVEAISHSAPEGLSLRFLNSLP